MNKILIAMMCCLTSSAAVHAADADNAWPQWRGPDGTGSAKNANPPIEWSETKNIRWKVAIAGEGYATPIIWGDRVYIQTAIKTDKVEKPAPDAAMESAPSSVRLVSSGNNSSQGFVSQQPADPRRRPRGRRGRGRRGRRAEKPTHVYRFVVMALDRSNGKTIWEKTVCETVPHEAGHPDSTQASNSPVTDGEHLYAYFGSRGLYCLNMDGKLEWKKDFGQMQTRAGFGEGSSPALYGDTIVVNWDQEGQSFVVALDKNTGKQLWKVDRDEQTSWTTPIIVEDGSTAGHHWRVKLHPRLQLGNRRGHLEMQGADSECHPNTRLRLRHGLCDERLSGKCLAGDSLQGRFGRHYEFGRRRLDA